MAKDANAQNNRGGRWLWFALSVLLGLPLLALCGLTLVGPPSLETIGVSVCVMALVVAGMIAPWRDEATYAGGIALLLLSAIVIYRLVEADAGASLRTYTGPAMGDGRMLDRLVPERDVAIGGSNLLVMTGQIREPGLLDALRGGYDRMRSAEGAVPSSVISTFAVGQTPEDHTVHRYSPGGRFDAPEAAVVFLHGYIGNVTLECWQVAQAAGPVGLDTFCPSTEWTGRWADRDGRAIVASTLAHLRSRGVRRVYLIGLSAGAIGASRMAHALDIEGLVLISGASRQANPARVPTLVLQGDRDTMTPPGPARAYARRAARARYVEVEGASHWLILSHHERVTEELRRWLARREGLEEIHE